MNNFNQNTSCYTQNALPNMSIGNCNSFPLQPNYDLTSQQAVVYINFAELMQSYVNGCKQMFEMGIMAGKMAKKSPVTPGHDTSTDSTAVSES